MSNETVDWKFRVVFGTYERLVCGLDAYPVKESDRFVLKPVFIVPAHLGCVKVVSMGGPILASGGHDEVIKLFDVRQKKELGSLHQHEGSITALAFYQSSHMLSGGEDGSICIWRTRDWECLKILRGHKGMVHDVSIHVSGRVAFSVGKDQSLRMWDLVKGRLAFTKKLPWVADKILFSPNGVYFALISDRLVQWYQTENILLLHEISLSKRVHALYWYQDSRYLWTGGEDKIIRCFHTGNGRCLVEIEGHDARIRCLSIAQTEDQAYLISGSSDGTIRVWRIPSLSDGDDTRRETLLMNRNDCVGDYLTTCRLTCVTCMTAETSLSLPEHHEEEISRVRDVCRPVENGHIMSYPLDLSNKVT